MKQLLVLAIAVTFMSCMKNSVIVQHWQVKRGQDTTTWSDAYFCRKSDFQGIDTIPEVYVDQPNSSYYLKGTIKVLSRVPFDALYIRKYLYYLKQID